MDFLKTHIKNTENPYAILMVVGKYLFLEMRKASDNVTTAKACDSETINLSSIIISTEKAAGKRSINLI